LAKQMQAEMAAGDSHQATKAPVTERNVTRSNVSRGPQGTGMEAVIGQMMQGRGQQQSMMSGGRA
jgi:hypothetical protein